MKKMKMTKAKRALLLLLVLSSSSFILHPSSLGSPAGPVQPGMTMSEVRKALGPPDHVARQLLYQRTREHWLYQKPQPVCLVFDWQRGQAPRLITIRSTSPDSGS